MKLISQIIHADIAHKHGFLGKNIGIAFLDTGIYPHKEFYPADQRIAGFIDYVHHRSYPYDDNGHGTHITGIAASASCGIAPAAHIISLKVLDALGNGNQRTFLNGLSWIHHFHKQYGIRIVNISIGTPASGNDEAANAIVKQVNQLWDDGLVVCIASGNNGPRDHSITAPGNSRKIITVGSSDDASRPMGSQRFAKNYSSRGPTSSCVMKPDVVAPGTNIYSCGLNGGHSIKSGTSMATPAVSGAIALLLERYPYYTNKDVKMKLRYNCDKLSTPRNHQGWGQINVQKLLDL